MVSKALKKLVVVSFTFSYIVCFSQEINNIQQAVSSQDEKQSPINPEESQNKQEEKDELNSLQEQIDSCEKDLEKLVDSKSHVTNTINRLLDKHFRHQQDEGYVFFHLGKDIEEQKKEINHCNQYVKGLRAEKDKREEEKKYKKTELDRSIAGNELMRQEIAAGNLYFKALNEEIGKICGEGNKLKNEKNKLDKLLHQEKDHLEGVKSWDDGGKKEYAQNTIRQRIDNLEDALHKCEDRIYSLLTELELKQQKVSELQNKFAQQAEEKKKLEQTLQEKGLPSIIHERPEKHIVELYQRLKNNPDELKKMRSEFNYDEEYEQTLQKVAFHSLTQNNIEIIDLVREEQREHQKQQKAFWQHPYVTAVAWFVLPIALGYLGRTLYPKSGKAAPPTTGVTANTP